MFEKLLSVPEEDIDFDLRALAPVAWGDFLLNPRRLRGSDFLMRWSQGRWSEERVTQAVNDTGSYYAIAYGPSSTAPDDVREFELYFEALEKANPDSLKRPDLLVFKASDRASVDWFVEQKGGNAKLPFTLERELNELLSLAMLAVECENSLWQALRMPDYGVAMKPQKWLGGGYGMKKSAVIPTVIIKDEDRTPLRDWQLQTGIPIHIWQVFYDLAYGIAFDKAEWLIENGSIKGTEQVFQAPGGATTRKVIYKLYYHYAYALGISVEEPVLRADYVIDKNGHILPYVRFEGGKMELTTEALQVLDGASGMKETSV